MSIFGFFNHRSELNKVTRATERAALGNVIYDLIAGYNDLSAKHVALLAHLDTADVAGIGNGNTAAFSPTARPVIATPEQRDAGAASFVYPRATI